MSGSRNWDKLRRERGGAKQRLKVLGERGHARIRPSHDRPRKCEATTKKGKPCRGGAMRGTNVCGPHLDSGYGSSEVQTRKATTADLERLKK